MVASGRERAWQPIAHFRSQKYLVADRLGAKSDGQGITRKGRGWEGVAMQYRLYLLNDAREIRAAESFIADDNAYAHAISVTVFSSCSDNFCGYELWCGAEKVADDRMRSKANINWWSVMQVRQRDVLDLIDRLQRGFECVRKSQQLLDRIAELRTTGE